MRADFNLFLAKTGAQGLTGFLNDNIVMHQCPKIALDLDHYRVVKVRWFPSLSVFEDICNHRTKTLFHARFKLVVQLIFRSCAQLHTLFFLLISLIHHCSFNQKAIAHI